MIRILYVLIFFFFVPLLGESPQEPLLAEPARPEIYEDNRFFEEFLHMLLILGFIVAGLLFASWLLKRVMSNRLEQMNVSSAIKVLERRPITPKSSIYLLEIHDRRIVVGESLNGLTLLADFRSNANFERLVDQEEE